MIIHASSTKMKPVFGKMHTWSVFVLIEHFCFYGSLQYHPIFIKPGKKNYGFNSVILSD